MAVPAARPAPPCSFSVYLALAALCTGMLLGWPAAAEQYSVPGVGALQLDMPKSWRVQQQAGPASIYLQIRPEGGELDLQFTSMWLPADKLAQFTPASIKSRVEDMAKDVLPNAVEAEAELVELKGKELAGYYFRLTDRSPKPGELKHLTRGMLAGPKGVAVFTILHAEASMPERQQALAMLEGATQSRDESTRVPLAQDSIRVLGHRDRYDVWVPASRIYMALPRMKLAPKKSAFGGSTDNPRYFFFEDEGFNVSGWFEPAGKFAGMRKFWTGETRAWSERGLPAPTNVVFKKIGGWDAVLYDNASPAGTSSHIRAHWVQSGTWIDLHLSLASSHSSNELRAALERFLKAVSVLER